MSPYLPERIQRGACSRMRAITAITFLSERPICMAGQTSNYQTSAFLPSCEKPTSHFLIPQPLSNSLANDGYKPQLLDLTLSLLSGGFCMYKVKSVFLLLICPMLIQLLDQPKNLEEKSKSFFASTPAAVACPSLPCLSVRPVPPRGPSQPAKGIVQQFLSLRCF